MKKILIICILGILSATGHAYERLQGPTQLLYWDRMKTYDGYTLFGAQGVSYLLDMEGCVVHTWPLGINPRLLDNGNLLDATNGDITGFSGFKEVDWNGSNVWSHTESRTGYFPHGDFLRIYNPKLGTNTTLYLANKAIASGQCIAAGCNPANGAYTNVTVDAIVEVDPSGTVIWEWCFFDHGVQDFDASKSNYVTSIADCPGRLNLNLPGRPLTNDWLHCTALDYSTNLDQIVVNAAGGEFYVIDHGKTFLAGNPAGSIALAASTNGDFMYRFGDPARYGQGNPPSIALNWTVSTTGNKQIGGVSQAQWIPAGLPGAGHLLVFNNGQDLFETTPQSYVFELNGFLNASGTDTGAYVNPPTAGYTTWSPPGHDTDKQRKSMSKQIVAMFYAMANQAFFSHTGGSAQRLPNGNTLVCACTEGHIFEATAAGEVVWEYISPVTTNGIVTYKRDDWPLANPVYRATRYSATHPALAGHPLTGTNTIAGGLPSYISAPTISRISQNPVAPLSTNIVAVTAVVSNNQAVAAVTLTCLVGTSTNTITMTNAGAVYGASIPAYAAGTLVSYIISAQDAFGNATTSTLRSYTTLDTFNLVLGRPSANSITINALACTDLVAYVDYGTQSGLYANQTALTNLTANAPAEVDLTALQVNTRYYYRLCYKQAGESLYHAGQEHTFSTQRAPGSTFTFSIQGDSHPERLGNMFDPDLYTRTLLTAAADQPDFYMTIGDDFSVDNIPTNTINAALVTERYTLQRPYLGLIGSSAPLFLVNGNHEQAAAYLLDGTPNNIAVWAQTARNTYYPEPAPDDFYTGNTNVVPYIGLLRNTFAWTWGDALFVTIDPYWASSVCVDDPYWGGPKRTNMWDVTHGDAQYQWLKTTLEQSTAKYKFVFAHHVLGTGRGGIEEAGDYEWGGHNANGSWGFTTHHPSWALPLHQLMATNHVTIFFQGHDHLFVRQQLDGVTYLTLPNPADSTYTFWNSDAYTNNVYKTNNTGYVRVTVSSANVKVDYVRTFLPADEGLGRTNGMVDYSFTLAALATTNQPPVITSVSATPAVPIAGNPIWVTARITDDVGVASARLSYSTGTGASMTNTVFLETMATNAVKPWTGAGCDSPWTVNYNGGNPFEQRAGANYGGGNTNGMEFKGGTTNLADSTITATNGIDARGNGGTVAFALWANGLTTNTGWAMQLSPGTGFTTRLSESTGSNHNWQLYNYSLLPGDLVSNLTTRFEFQGGVSSNRIDLDQISVKVVTGGTSWTNTAMYDDGLHGDGAAGDGIYGAQIPAQAAGATVSFYITATDGVGATATNPAAGAGGALFFVVSSGPATPPFDVLLGRPADSSIAVSVMPATNLQMYCQYGTQPGSYTGQTTVTNLTAGTPGALTLDALLADTLYYYRLRYRELGATNYNADTEHTFHTQRASTSAFTFVIEADPHWQDPNASVSPALWQVALTNMLADTPDFLIDLGDTFMTEKLGVTNYAGAAQLCRDVRSNQFSVIGPSLPLFLVNGNHEAELGWELMPAQPQSNIAVWATQARQLYYPCPVPGSFYSGATNADAHLLGPRDGHYAFRWGNTLFVVLDPFWSTTPKPGAATCWNWTLGTNQYQWLQQTLAQSTAAFKFVFIHHLVGGSFDGVARGGAEFAPYFEWGGHNTNGIWGFTDNRPGWPMPIQNLLLSNGVNAVFHGHDHLFVKQDLDSNGDGIPDLIYQECPQPSYTNYNSTNTAAGYGYTSGVIQGSSGHLRVHVTPAEATIEYVRAYLPADEGTGKTNRMVTYAYTITAPLAITGTVLSVTAPTPTNAVMVSATILARTNLSQVALIYIAGGATNTVNMIKSGTVHSAQIPAFGAGTTVTYYIRAQNVLGHVVTDPASGVYSYTVSALANYWSMLALPDTGQIISYTSTFGEDSDYAIHPPAYLDNGDGTISDKVTGLMWQQTDGGEMTWESAGAYAATNRFGGYTDWRLPTSHELYSISKQGALNPAIDTNYFTVTLAEYWWTRDQQVSNTNTIWVVNAGGGIGNHPKAETISAGGSRRFHVRCVRGAAAPSTASPIHHFTNNANGTVTDADTGLTWQQAEIVTATNWEGALQYAVSLALGGKTDWRLPNIKELESLNDETLAMLSVDSTYFPGATASRYWSSTTMHNSTNEAWYLDCQYGVTSYTDKGSNLLVRCVRGGTTNIASVFTAQFVRIPVGSYVMGDHFGFVDPDHPNDELPLHNVHVSPLYMNTTLITCREYCDYLNAALFQGLIEVRSNIVYAVGGTNDYFHTYGASVYSRIQYTNATFVVLNNHDLHPITSVRWFGAIAYCNWLSQRGDFKPCYNLDTGDVDFTKNGFRLPTEAEWEYAGRGSLTNPYCMFPWGTNSNVDGTYANWEGSGDPFETGSYPYTTPVGFYNGALRLKSDYNWPGSQTTYQTSDGSNPYGLYDMAGNVWEWVNDWYASDYYTNCLVNGIITNPPGPTTGTIFADHGNIAWRNLRGGTWYNGGGQSNYGFSRVSNRDPSWSRGPSPDGNDTSTWFQVGFRVMRPDKAATTVGLILNASSAYSGYTLMSPMHSTNTYLINNAGQVVHKWTNTGEPGRSSYLLENGHLIRSCAVTIGGPSTGGGEGGRLEEKDWLGNLVWAIDYVSTNYIQHHDFKVLPSGNVLLLVAEKKSYAEVVAAGFNTNQLDSSILTQGYMLPDCLIEVQPTKPYGGAVVWEWHMWDHMIQDTNATKNNYGVVANHPELIDANGTGQMIQQFWNHVNGIDYNAQLDQIMLSVRNNSELFVIDHQLTTAQAAGHTGGRYGKGGDILYRWGNAAQYDRGASSPQMLYQQHHTHWIAANCPGAGHILIFNNGIGRGYSTVNEIVPPVDAYGNYSLSTGAAFGPSTAFWTYVANPATNFYSAEISGAQRLPNGDTLICEGVKGNLFEVTTNGVTVWQYMCPETTAPLAQGSAIPVDSGHAGQYLNAVFRVTRYPTSFLGLAGKDLTPRGTVETYTGAATDTVGLGLPDIWVRAHFGNLAAVASTSDHDDDGLTDIREYQYGTDPAQWSSPANGIPDGWALAHGFDPTLAGTATLTNLNGCTTLQSYSADLDPANPASRLAIINFIAISNDIHLTWTGGTNAWQYLECAPTLATNPWSAIFTNIPPTARTNSIAHHGPEGASKLFYRIRARR